MTGNYSRDQVMKVISSVMAKVGPQQAQPLNHIREELEHLATIIDSMHAEIMATRPHDVGGKHIPTATDELDAVIGATESASATIMDSCEAIQARIESLTDEAVKNDIANEITRIFEACSFQDITGQRISKVVKTLRHIESSVDDLLNLFGGDAGGQRGTSANDDRDTRNEEESLMNGPQLDGKGVSQDDIDRLLAEFD